MASQFVSEVNDAEFEAQVLKSDTPVLVDFWAAWCGPCRALAPIVDQIASDFQGKVKVMKMDVDRNNITPKPLWHSWDPSAAGVQRRPGCRADHRLRAESANRPGAAEGRNRKRLSATFGRGPVSAEIGPFCLPACTPRNLQIRLWIGRALPPYDVGHYTKGTCWTGCCCGEV